jgi:hypothetical protein
MEENELLSPKPIGIVGADAVMKRVDLIANLVKELRHNSRDQKRRRGAKN